MTRLGMPAPSTPPVAESREVREYATPKRRLLRKTSSAPSDPPGTPLVGRRLSRKTSMTPSDVPTPTSLKRRILTKSPRPDWAVVKPRLRLLKKTPSDESWKLKLQGQFSDSDSEDSDSASDAEMSDLSSEEELDFDGTDGFEVQTVKPTEAVSIPLRRHFVKGPQFSPAELAALPKAAPQESYIGDWAGSPAVGSPGFNDFAASVMKKAGLASEPLRAELDTKSPCPPMQPHQEAAVFMLHPKSPITRMLVDHPTGSGKTREMIQILANYFDDPRPKVPIFPKEPVCRNFYAELLRWPSQYRDYFSCLKPQLASIASGERCWQVRRQHLWNLSKLDEKMMQELVQEIRDVLEMKGCFYKGKMREKYRENFQKRFPGEPLPAAPLRALRYTSAGGSHAGLREDGLPMSSLFKICFDRKGGNVYSNKVVIMDEVHNLVRKQTMYEKQLGRLRELLSTAKGSVLAGFTGTPILSEKTEGYQLLDIIKGSAALAASLNNEGFLSSFPMRPPPLFPVALPAGLPDCVLTPKMRLQFVRKVNLAGENLQKYDLKRGKGLPEKRLRAYCNLSVYFGSLHKGKNSSRDRILADFQNCAPKLSLIAEDVASEPTKALVLIERRSGLEALLAHLQELSTRSFGGKFGVATMEELADFNSPENLRGEKYRVLVADAMQCSEGVSFFGVRRVMLADVPANPSAFVQSVGRAVRMYGHQGLPAEEQTVTTTLYCAGFPSWMRSPLGAWAYRAQKRHKDAKEAESKTRKLLRALQRVGVRTLDDLKKRVDSHFARCTKERELAEAAALAEAQANAAEAAFFAANAPVDVEMPPVSPETEESVPADQQVQKPEQKQEPQQEEQSVESKVPILSTDDAVSLLETIGLWNEAKLIRDSEAQAEMRKLKKQKSNAAAPGSSISPTSSSQFTDDVAMANDSSPTASESATSSTTAGSDSPAELASQNSSADLSEVASPSPSKEAFESPSKDQDGSSSPTAAADEAPLAAAEQDSAAAVSKEKKEKRSYAGVRRHYLVRALQLLCVAESTEEAIEKLNLSSSTADEDSLKRLASSSKELVPALAELRRLAVDREVLSELTSPEHRFDEQMVSDGEDSVYEFDIGIDSGDEAPAAAAKATKSRGSRSSKALVLPMGWAAKREKTSTGHSRRVFVGPTGTTFTSPHQARHAVDAVRRVTNVSESLRSQFEARLKERERKAAEAAAAAAAAADGEEAAAKRLKVQ
eukprot:TRINITY_DN9411_c1_g2_i1.p1 TRINITY_DN9411_c1_g2~~TRINITY_DN9411_c1_g2_i1.p1  ORF type:complete len:1223 (-),score=345.33 TRINITY_DN9411_c1_g2_i1:175-3843(-)